jgi:pullulanase
MGLPLVRGFAEKGVRQGLAVFRFNWAYTAAKGQPSEDLSLEIEDMRTVLELVRRSPLVDPERIFLAGKSMGTLVAYRLFRQSPDVKGILLFTPLCTSSWTEAGERRPEPIPSGEENYPGLAEEPRPVWMGLGDRDPLCQLSMLHGFLQGTRGHVACTVVGGNHGLNLGPWNDPAFAEVNARNIAAGLEAGLHWVDLQLDHLRRRGGEVQRETERSSGGGEVETLGAVVRPGETVFSLWSPDHKNVELVLKGQAMKMFPVPDFAGYSSVYQLRVPGKHHGQRYHFRVGGQAVRDPYGKMAEPQKRGEGGKFGAGESVVLDQARCQLPGGWSPRPPLKEREDAVIYEVHVRDFTHSPTSGVAPELRGKFLGMVARGAKYKGQATGLDHLVELGVTHVQLMPVYDFGSCPDLEDQDCYNWGYDPRNFNVPEERYSLTPRDWTNRSIEFKQMVNGLHKAGLRVVMDVVYNHSFAREMFEGITPRYFTPTDLSGCGNSLDATNPMVGRMIRDSLEYWIRDYGVDGFRFDLAGIFDAKDVAAWSRHLHATFPGRKLLLYGEPWNGYVTDPREANRLRLGNVGSLKGAHFGVFNPKFRDALKGRNDSGDSEPGDGFVFGAEAGQVLPDTLRIALGGRGAIRLVNDLKLPIDTWDPAFATDPEQAIQYVSAHDNLTLRDKILAWAREQKIAPEDPRLLKIQKFALGVLLTSQGVPFLHGGVELLRSKQGDHNSYRSPDAVNQFDWHWKLDNADMLAYTRKLIALRSEYPGLRLHTWQEIHQRVFTTRPRTGVVVHRIAPSDTGEPEAEMLVIWNSGSKFVHALPRGSWKRILGGEGVAQGSVEVAATAVTLLSRN